MALEPENREEVERGKHVLAELASARSHVTEPALNATTRDEAVIKLHDAVVAAKAEARSGNRYVLDHAKRYPTEYGFLDDGFDEESEVRAYERAVEAFGEQNVAVVNGILEEIDSLYQSSTDIERPEPSYDAETGSYMYNADGEDQGWRESARADIERRVDAAWQRLMALHDDGNGYVEQAAQSNAELFARMVERKAAMEDARQNVPGSWENPIQIGHSIEQQLRYAASGEARPQSTVEGDAMKNPEPVPGSWENPIQIGHSIELQQTYAASKSLEPSRERRVIHDAKPDSVEMFRELYQDVVRTGDSFPIGALERHAEGRLQQTYAALVLIENARAAGIIPENSKFVATGAKVQDKRASKAYPAAHRLPADLSIQASDGSLSRLTDHLTVDLDRIWVDKNIFAPTDRIHRLANVADQWVEDGGMKTAFVNAANAVSSGKLTAEEALEDIVQPGYAAAHARALEKVERNFTLIERQALSQRIVDQHGQPYRKVPEPTVLKIKGLEERAAAKDVMERTLKAYSRMEELSPSLRMKSNLAVNGIIDNEIRLREHGPNSRRALAPGEAMVEARRAAGEANTALTKQMDEIIQLGNKASAAAAAAADPSRPMEARMRAMGDAGAYGEAMKTAWAKLQNETGPQVVKGLSERLERCGPHAGGHLAAVRSRLASPPKEVLQAANQIEDAQEKLQRANRSQVDFGQRNSVRQSFGQRPTPSME